VLPWENPTVLASAFSLVMLGLGGASGFINMSYTLNSTIHNTQWVTGHFHLIFGGAIVIVYFAIAYELWPRLLSRPLAAPKLVRLQLWSWFVGMLVVALPWHLVGVMGEPRRMAYYDFNNPGLAQQAIWVSVSAIGGFVLVFSAFLLITILLASHRRPVAVIPPLTFALALRPVRKLPVSLNSFGVWMLLVVALTVANYGYPLVQLLVQPDASVPAYRTENR
jgi:cytochrome c oxidase subunit 1